MTGLRKLVTTGLRLGVLLVISTIGVRGDRPPRYSFVSATTMADHRPAPIHSMAVTVHPPPATAAPTETHPATPALHIVQYLLLLGAQLLGRDFLDSAHRLCSPVTARESARVRTARPATVA